MAHYAELDKNNVVIRVLTACNQDIADNGGELSEQAANYFGTYTPFLKEGVKWVQTSYNSNFRKQYAAIGYTYDSVKDKFIAPQPFQSWILDSNDDWEAPVAYPTILTYSDPSEPNIRYSILWDEDNKKWIAEDKYRNEYEWSSQNLSWILTWEPPVAYPTVKTYGDNIRYSISWDEDNQRWIGKDNENNEFIWIPSSSSWIATGN
jgi:hypothetical protein